MKLKDITYYNHCDDRSQIYPRLDITMINKGQMLIELSDNRYMINKKNAVKYFEWVIEQIKTLPDIQDK